MDRRDVLKFGAALGLGAMFSGCAPSRSGKAALAASGAAAKPARTRVLRVAHLTDFHIQPERDAFTGVAECLRHAQSLKDRPQAILTGGDLIMDGFAQPYERTKAQWDLFQTVLKDECSTPVFHTLGNHDIWGWDKAKSRTQGNEPGWGKAWACEMIGRDRPYGFTDIAGVRIISLDSVREEPTNSRFGYVGYCDDEQYAWLESTLAGTSPQTPVMIVSHIPIVSATGLIGPKTEMKTDDHRVSRGIMHADASKLAALFRKQPNVKTCLSGHMHLLDRVEIQGVTYLCNGAVSGGWWRGANNGTEAGYAIVDLYSDGSVEREYVTYGWEYRQG